MQSQLCFRFLSHFKEVLKEYKNFKQWVQKQWKSGNVEQVYVIDVCGSVSET
jgi:hypothetical protein